MPYHIGDKGTHGCSGYPVVKDSDSTVMGCHKTKASAQKQLAALYANEPEASKVDKASDGFVPPATVRANAKRGLELRREFGRGGTEVGIARARDLSNGSAISLSTIKRMNSFFARHEVDKKGENWGDRSNPSNGYIAWLLWGGDAGWSWAKKIINQEESKEKSTMSSLTTSYFGIEKADKNSDGTMTVYGKATDDSLDIDQQICDADWLERAMPHWFKSGGNIREQHSNIAAGVAKEYEQKGDGHYITALVVDPVSVKKVETGVLKGFSVGIKSPRVIRDAKAANGRIVDGQIVEISLVDRPANPNCQLVLAKSVGADNTVIQVEELHEKSANKNNNLIQSGNISEKESGAMATEKTISIPKSIVGELVKFDKGQFEAAREALANLISVEAQEMKDGHDEISSISHLLEAVAHLSAWYQGEVAEGEVDDVEDDIENAADEMLERSAKKEADDSDDDEDSKKKKAKMKEADDESDDEDSKKKKVKEADESDDDESDDEDSKKKSSKKKSMKKDAEADDEKCADCGMKMDECKCDMGMKDEKSDAATDMTPTYETGATLNTATIVSPDQTPKSVSAEQAEKLENLVEEVVEKATKALKSEIASLLSAKEAAENEAMALKTELATAKSLALGGGPKRAASPVDVKATEDLLTKASVYNAKAQATTDPVLAKGYKQLAKEFLAKYEETQSK